MFSFKKVFSSTTGFSPSSDNSSSTRPSPTRTTLARSQSFSTLQPINVGDTQTRLFIGEGEVFSSFVGQCDSANDSQPGEAPEQKKGSTKHNRPSFSKLTKKMSRRLLSVQQKTGMAATTNENKSSDLDEQISSPPKTLPSLPFPTTSPLTALSTDNAISTFLSTDTSESPTLSLSLSHKESVKPIFQDQKALDEVWSALFEMSFCEESEEIFKGNHKELKQQIKELLSALQPTKNAVQNAHDSLGLKFLGGEEEKEEVINSYIAVPQNQWKFPVDYYPDLLNAVTANLESIVPSTGHDIAKSKLQKLEDAITKLFKSEYESIVSSFPKPPRSMGNRINISAASIAEPAATNDFSAAWTTSDKNTLFVAIMEKINKSLTQETASTEGKLLLQSVKVSQRRLQASSNVNQALSASVQSGVLGRKRPITRGQLGPSPLFKG